MLIDKLKEIEKKNPELVTEAQGACRYCGQIKMTKFISKWDAKLIDQIVTEQCSCSEAKEFVKFEKSRMKAKESAEKLFSESKTAGIKSGTVDLMNVIIDAVADGTIEKANISVVSGIRANIQMTSKGCIRVKREVRSEVCYDN